MNRFFRLTGVLAVILLSSCNADNYCLFTGYAQGGTYSVKANLRDVDKTYAEISGGIGAILDSIDNTLSGYNKGSVLSRRNAGEDVPTEGMFDEVLALCDYYKQMSGGAFDASSGPLFDVWGFGFSGDSFPDSSLVARALAECGNSSVLNFNAIAQGYSCDKVALYLKSLGVKDMLVDIGEIYCEGLNPSGKPWSIGIDTPYDGNMTPGQSLSGVWTSDGSACGVVTSGNYRKYYIRDGRKYAHIIDPRTGWPVSHNLLSATVTAPTAAAADALATICMVIGPEASMSLIDSLDGTEALLITSDGILRTEGFNLSE